MVALSSGGVDAVSSGAPSTLNSYSDLRGVKLGEVRRSIPDRCYKRSRFQAIAWATFDLTLYLAGQSLVFGGRPVIVQLLGGLLAGAAVSMMFIWAHDAAHGALFRSKAISELLGTVLMMPSLNMYRLWSYGHNKVHHGFTSFSPIDWIWRPMSPSDYASSSRWARFVYRRERNLMTCGLHYLIRVWWRGMVRFTPQRKRDRITFSVSKVGTLLFAIGLSYLAWTTAGGLVGVLSAVVIPFAVFTYVIALFVYIHHTHPSVPFFDVRDEWSATIGQLFCSTVIRTSKVTDLLTHHILVHVPHHVDMRIPFYHLPKACEAIKTDWGKYLHEYRFSWSQVRSIFGECQLFDFDTKTWHRFDDHLAYVEFSQDLKASIVSRPTALSS